MKKISLAIIGAGVRGTYTYGKFIEENKEICEVVAVVEARSGRREYFANKFNLREEMVFENIQSFFEKDKICDGLIICNYDNLHFDTAKIALEKGYNVLLEGPLVNSLDQIIYLKDISKENKNKVFMPCMPYRYSSFFNKIKEIINSKSLGDLININYNSNIGYENFVHNYVRGNWRIDSDSATLLLTNSCYDLDILSYLTNSSCKKISTFASLNHFKKINLTENMGSMCYKCKEDKECPFSASIIYLEEEKDFNKAIHIDPTKENMRNILREGQYGKCVYNCDNDMYDNLVSIMKYENNVAVTLNTSAFTKEENLELRLLFTYGEVKASFKDKNIKIRKFINNDLEVIKLEDENLDYKVIYEFLNLIKEENYNRLDIQECLESHIVAFAGEFANVCELVVDVKDFYKESEAMTKTMSNIF